MKKMKYCFESTYVPYSTCEIDVEIGDGKYCFFLDGVDTIIDLNKAILERKSEEMYMKFDFSNRDAYMLLNETSSKLPIDIIDYDLVCENNILHLDFKYKLQENMYVSMSIF